MTEVDREKIIDKVRKLMAKAHGNTNENEAAIFAEKAHALLAMHNLSMSEIDDSGKKDPASQVERDSSIKSHSYPWRRQLGMAVASLYFCNYFYSKQKIPGRNARAGFDFHTFVGRRHDIEVAKLMAVYLMDTVDRLAAEGAKKHSGSRSSYITSFTNACSVRLCHRIAKRIEDAKSGTIKMDGGTNLPALLSLYEQATERNRQFLQEQSIEVKEKSSRMRSKSIQGYMDGSDAGDQISLDAQITGGGKSTAQIGR